MNNESVDQYALIGYPIAHSKSPLIHTLFAKQFNHNLEYRLLPTENGNFQDVVKSFRKMGGAGANVTAPFKINALTYADNATERARIAGSANTLKFLSDGSCFADNTDGIGLLRDLKLNLKWQLHNKKVLVIGAGGAVCGILGPLLQLDNVSIVLSNRTHSKAIALANKFDKLGSIKAVEFCHLKSINFDFIINGTSASLFNEVPHIPQGIINNHIKCYDLVYSAKPTSFLQWAEKQGCLSTSDGLGMLVEQAAESFRVWRNISPNSQSVIQALKKSMNR